MPRFFEKTLFNTTLRTTALVAAIAALALCAVWARPALATAPDFSDVADSAWYGGSDGYVAYVAEKGIMTGYAGTDLFGPEDKLTRAQAVTAMFRSTFGDPNGLTSDPAVYSSIADETQFSDTEDGAYYTYALNWAASEGIVQGYNGKFRPNDPVTREELVTMLGRAVDNYYPPFMLPEYNIKIVDEDSISDWALPHMKWANRIIIHGNPVEYRTPEGVELEAVIMRPQDDATRAETAKVLARFHELIIQNMRAENTEQEA